MIYQLLAFQYLFDKKNFDLLLYRLYDYSKNIIFFTFFNLNYS